MGSVPVPRTEAAHLGLLRAKMDQEVQKLLFFTPFTAPILTNKISGERSAPVAPIAEQNQFVSEGMDNMLIPVMKSLVGTAFYGDAIVSGLGEKQRWDYIKTFVNNLSFPVEGPAIMSNQRVKGFQLISKIRPQLSLRMAQEQEVEICSAFYEGYGRSVTTAAASHGLGQTKRYHPNFYVAGSGIVTWNGTQQTHANNLGAALAGLTDTSSDHFSVDNLENLRAEVQKIPLQPVMVQGKPYYVMLVHHNQMRQLRTDSKWNENASRGHLRGLQNPIFAMAEAYYANFLIYEREFSVFGVDEGTPVAGDYTLTMGATNPVSAVDTENKKMAIIFGNGAISKGVGGPINFGQHAMNIQSFDEIAIRQVFGTAVNTFYDVDVSAATPTTGINQSSAIFATFSANAWA